MIKAPYSPWGIKLDDFPVTGSLEERSRFLVQFALLAPSAHNTQPWKFKISDNRIELYSDPQRHLKVSDPTGRELYLSLGAAIANLEAGASSYGYSLKLIYTLKDNHVATLSWEEGQSSDDWRAAMLGRRSCRLPYNRVPLEAEVVESIKRSAVGDSQVQLFTDDASIAKIAEATAEGSLLSLSQPLFRRELSQWVRHNWTNQPDGMPGFVQNMPGPVSLLAKVIIPNLNIGKQQAKTDRTQMLASAAIAIVTVPQESSSSWLDAGRTLEKVWLVATKHGLDASSIASAIEVASVRSELISSLGLAQPPVAILRIGKANKPSRHSPRQTLEQVLI